MLIVSALLYYFKDESDKDLIYKSIPIALPIFYYQFKVLIRNNKWSDYVIVLAVGMFVYLFILGIIISWNPNHEGGVFGSLFNAIKGGVMLLFLGSVFGAMIGYPFILVFNLLFKSWIFNDNIKEV